MPHAPQERVRRTAGEEEGEARGDIGDVDLSDGLPVKEPAVAAIDAAPIAAGKLRRGAEEEEAEEAR